MKKIIVSIILTVSLLALLIPAVSAENIDAFSTITLDGQTEKYINADTDTSGGGGNPIAYVEGFGCGYSSIDDIVWFENVDFGNTGAESMNILFSYGKDVGETTDIAVYMDDYTDDAFLCGTLQVGFTGGWTINEAQNFTFPCKIDRGVHNIYIKFTTANSGSFSQLSFTTDKTESMEEQTEPVYEGEKITDPAVFNIFNAELPYIFNTPNDTNIEFTDEGVRFVATKDTNDPYVTFNFKRYCQNMGIENPISADDYAYMVIKLKADQSIDGATFELFGNCGDVLYAGADSAIIGSDYDACGEWVYALCDFSLSGNWAGSINNIRFDWCVDCTEGSSLVISEVRFFKDEDEALNFIDGVEPGDESAAVTTAATAETTVPETAADTTAAQAAGTTATAEETTEKAKSGGCGGVVSFGVLGIALIIPFGFAIRKKH